MKILNDLTGQSLDTHVSGLLQWTSLHRELLTIVLTGYHESAAVGVNTLSARLNGTC